MECERPIGKAILEQTRSRKLCPLIEELGDECFCSDLRSQNVEAAIFYCNGNFEECEIYRRKMRS
jgi:hypothetical protein